MIMAVSLFRRWRSQKFSDLVGQEAVVSTLHNVLRSGNPARVYLFCGPRGTGKTSSARIFAKAINCEKGPAEEPCCECGQCRSIVDGTNLDVFEIDAASNTQVDKIRDFIVEKVQFAPVAARFKVYIIDEVHKLSTSSFNALLKTFEEPPAHVVFILATTHPHEVPDTILSRCQRYDFRPLTAAETERHLLKIAQAEKISLQDDAARQLARAADGSLRDALVLLEQAMTFSQGQVTQEKVLDLLGDVGYQVLEQMFLELIKGQTALALRRLDEWLGRGRDLKRLAESFQDHLRMLLLLKVGSEDDTVRHLSQDERASLEKLVKAMSLKAISSWLRRAMELLASIRAGHAARLEWELTLLSCAQPEVDPSFQGLERRIESLEAAGPIARTVTAVGTPEPDIARSLNPVLTRLDALEAGADIDALRQAITSLEERLSRIEVDKASTPAQEAFAQQEPVYRAPSQEVESHVSEQPHLTPSHDFEDPVDAWLVMPAVLVDGSAFRDPPDQERSSNSDHLDALRFEPDTQGDEALSSSLPEELNRLSSEGSLDSKEPLVESCASGIADLGPRMRLEPAEFWRGLMQAIKGKDMRLHGVLADANLAALSEDAFEIALPEGYTWHAERVEQGRVLLEQAAKELVGGVSMRLACHVGGDGARLPHETEHEEMVSRAAGVFGGASIIE